MRLLLIVVVLILCASCKEDRQKQKTVLPPDFDKEFSLDTSIKFQHGRDVAYGYSFSYPVSFVQVPDTIGQVDSSMLYSPDRLTKIKFYVEGDTRRNKDQGDETEKSLFKHYFDSLTNSKHEFTQTARVVKSTYSFKSYEYGNPANFMLLGERDSTEFIMKTELSEIPISGELTFKSFIMEYPKNSKHHFRPVALEIAKSFGQ